MDVKFDLSWDNSYSGTDANGQAFFDRAWVFVKFWKSTWDQATQPWGHATLTTGGTLSTYSATTNTGITSDGKGAFASPGIGQTVRWNYSADGILSTDIIKVRVFAIEMVRIPTGSFYVGSGGTEYDAFYKYPTTTNAYLISSEAAINVGVTADYLYYPAVYNGGDQTGPIPAAFPKGYNAFYCMKYEISQGQWVNFFNTLSATQKSTRDITGGTLNSTGKASDAEVNRNTISWTSGDASAGTNQYVACNFLSWMDIAAYADWAGLRPMTELEYEKAARGPSTPVANEYAWGSTTITQATSILNSGANNEVAGQTGNGLCAYGNAANVQGPLRCGFAAIAGATRLQAGASYYGIMELSGNVWERPVTVGNTTGRAFTGTHGNGSLSTNGNANNSDWPGYVSEVTGATGVGFRGGSWLNVATNARGSDRILAASTSANRNNNLGGRAARTSP